MHLKSGKDGPTDGPTRLCTEERGRFNNNNNKKFKKNIGPNYRSRTVLDLLAIGTTHSRL